MTKVAAQRTAGILGDDLAVNAEQVSGVRGDRELPVVWAVAKGSALNKLILIPCALLLSVFLPGLITPMLMVGGAYLCFEGFEKVAHRLLHPQAIKEEHQAVLDALHDPELDLAEFEADKIKGAIRTDFVLSAEIIVISLGTVQGESLAVQTGVMVMIGILMTIGVYGFVAAIVRLDDLGYRFVESSTTVLQKVGAAILVFAPLLMKSLMVVGTIAMFLVGGGIIAHGIPGMENTIELMAAVVTGIPLALLLLELLLTGIAGMMFGALIAPFVAATTEILGSE